jgi:hypothetical protein
MCKLINGPVGTNEVTRIVTVYCLASRDTKLERQWITISVSVVGYNQQCASGSSMTIYLAIGASVLVIVIAVIVGVCVKKFGGASKQRRRRSEVGRSLGADIFYNDASGTTKQVGPYEDIADPTDSATSGMFNVYYMPEETYDELTETSAGSDADTTEVVLDSSLMTRPYEGLNEESQDTTKPSSSYKTLNAIETTSETATDNEHVIAPYQGLTKEQRELPPLPNTYRKLHEVPLCAPEKKSYEMLETTCYDQPQPPTEYRKLDCTVTQPTTSEDKPQATSSYAALQKKTHETSEQPGVYKKLDDSDTILPLNARATLPHSYIQIMAEHK